MLRRVALVRTDVSEKRTASIIRVKIMSELSKYVIVFHSLVTANIVSSSLIILNLIMEDTRSSETWFLKESHGLTSEKMAIFIITVAKSSNLTCLDGVQ
jgi:hypothetical protein